MKKSHLAVYAALLGAVLMAVLLALMGGGPGSVTVTVGGPHGTPPNAIEVPKDAVDAAKEGLEGHEGARSEQPAGVSAKALDAARDQQEALAASDQLPIVTPDAAPSQRGCTTRLVQNYSSRRGVRPRLFVLHYTVSGNRPGWDDVNAIVGLFDRPSFAASSNYVMDNEGHCAYIVRESDKAWTQAAANPVSISVEMVNTGRESTYAGSAGLSKLAMVMSDSLKRWGIPVQLGAVSGCTVTRPGIVDHGMLGACGGGHHDISPFRVAPVINAVKAFRAAEAKVTASGPLAIPPESEENAVCTVLNLEKRLAMKPPHGPDWKVDSYTRDAIRRLQHRYGIPETGYAGKLVGRILRLKWCRI